MTSIPRNHYSSFPLAKLSCGFSYQALSYGRVIFFFILGHDMVNVKENQDVTTN
jgi:hypothetical protein